MMEIVAAADSDERGLSLLRVVNILQRVVVFLHSFTVDKTRGQPPTSTSASKAQQMPGMSEEEVAKKVKEICQELILSQESLKEVCDRLQEEINKGLGKESNPEATIKCFPTYVRELPNGKEKGRFLALDLGGTNFRVLLIELGDKCTMESRIYAVPQPIMIGPGEGLFDHIADCLACFIKERSLGTELLPLGFTFSFPCKQEGLTKARLARWTKGFKCEGVEGRDVVELLKKAIAKRGDVKIKICAVLNDTTGTLMSCAWKNHNCRVGLIVGTGTNACYMEKIEKVELWDGDLEEPHQVIINTEWGAFGDNGCLDFIRTEYDNTIDRESLNPGKQLFEKMISGMYMGEVARQVIVRLVSEGLLFDGKTSDILQEKGSFFTKYISEIESDEDGDYNNCYAILEELGLNNATDADCANVRHVCECVSRRAAYLAGAGVALLLNRINEESVSVAVDGSVYRFHPHFHNLMVEQVSQLVKPGIKFDLMLSEDGSGRGAALVAAVASRSSATR
ncbi:hexokinase type 2-like isoform X1 [Penaeus japonicus]|uniref:hexokinase type 2-like isoform X1 n=1 Tax=Penaeus japonicus TaxID=27405 RepID=UPI001C70E939|nr:hexokinase type 2-like isoform X1 [Penaeus japonicus]UYO08027.1 hexokinase [Penaeus japonicus]